MKPKRSKQNLSLEKRMAKHGWVFISPLLAGFLFIYLEVIARSLLFSFQKVTPGDAKFEAVWIGLPNYYDALFIKTDYVRNLVSSILQMLYNVPLILIFSLFVATLLNQKLVGRSVFRAIFFIPAVLLTGAVADSAVGNSLMNALNNIDGISTGAVHQTFTLDDFQALFGGAVLNNDLYTYILGAVNSVFNVVKSCGVQILILIAGLQSIPASVYEAASMEGANGWDCYWKITFPLIMPMLYVNGIYTIVDSFTGAGNTVMRAIYELGYNQFKIGEAAAHAWMYFAAVLLLLGLITLFAKLPRRRERRDAA